MDKELEVLSLIADGHCQSQRQLASKTGMALGTVNILLKKMVREGLIKLETIPAQRAIYMLTPKGAQEKIEKTFNYIRIHYAMIERIKSGIYLAVQAIDSKDELLVLLLNNKEIDFITRDVLKECNRFFSVGEKSIEPDSVVLVDSEEAYLRVAGKGAKTINIMHYISLSGGVL